MHSPCNARNIGDDGGHLHGRPDVAAEVPSIAFSEFAKRARAVERRHSLQGHDGHTFATHLIPKRCTTQTPEVSSRWRNEHRHGVFGKSGREDLDGTLGELGEFGYDSPEARSRNLEAQFLLHRLQPVLLLVFAGQVIALIANHHDLGNRSQGDRFEGSVDGFDAGIDWENHAACAAYAQSDINGDFPRSDAAKSGHVQDPKLVVTGTPVLALKGGVQEVLGPLRCLADPKR
jgi:hypothetical protein